MNIEATGVAVTAVTSDKMFVIATTSGESAGTIGLNGIVSLSGFSNRTLASISNLATITTTSPRREADQLVRSSGARRPRRGRLQRRRALVAVMDAAAITRGLPSATIATTCPTIGLPERRQAA